MIVGDIYGAALRRNYSTPYCCTWSRFTKKKVHAPDRETTRGMCECRHVPVPLSVELAMLAFSFVLALSWGLLASVCHTDSYEGFLIQQKSKQQKP